MHKFWYHSPVRFYKNEEDLMDMQNPQNTSYFGGAKFYPLEVRAWHRFLLPIYDSEIEKEAYDLYLVNSTQRELISSSFYIKNGYLKNISFRSEQELEGRLEIVRKSDQSTLFYSNCIKFIDSTDYFGRKFIRVATRHSYSKNLFDFDDDENWFITNLPAYCLGMNNVDVDISNTRVGGHSTLRLRDTFIDETTTYQFEADGDSNVLDFVQVHSANDYFFIDGVQKICIEKLEKDEFSMYGTMTFANVKDHNGLNILFDEGRFFDFKYFDNTFDNTFE